MYENHYLRAITNRFFKPLRLFLTAMPEDNSGAKRRTVLKATSGAVAAGAFSGLASAGDATVEVNVGYENDRGRGAAMEAASEVVREFNFDALTMRVSRNAIEGLEQNPHVRYVEENGTMEALAQSVPWGQDRVDSEVAHANGETFGEIVDRDREDEQPDPSQGCSFGAFPTGLEMLVWQAFIDQRDRAHTQQDRNANNRCGRCPALELAFRRVQCRNDEREKRRGQHHARSKAEQQVARGSRRNAPE